MIVKTREQFEAFLTKLAEQPEVVVDTETTGLNVWHEDQMCGIGFAFSDLTSYYLPFRHKQFDSRLPLLSILEQNSESVNLPLEWVGELWDTLKKVNCLIGHNIKFDLAAMSRDNYDVKYNWKEPQLFEDTLSGARLYRKNKDDSLKLDDLVEVLIDPEASKWKRNFAAYLKERNIKDHYDQGEVDVVGEYCERDCRYTFQIREILNEFANKTAQKMVLDTERQVVTALWYIEKAGLRLDLDYIDFAISECQRAFDAIMAEIVKITGCAIKIFSNKDVGTAFDQLGIKSPHLTPSGAPSWADEALTKIKHPLAKLILDARRVDKMVNTFFEPYKKNLSGYVHPSFKPWGAITGRFSCSNPNLQQVSRPEPFDIGCLPDFDVQVRRMFIAPENFKLVAIDYCQMEMIGFADYLADKQLTEKLNEGGVDYHTLARDLIEAASGIKIERKDAKAVSLGLIYGMGKEKLARRLEMTPTQAEAVKTAFFKAFPTARTFIERVYTAIRTRGYVFNRFDRKYFIEEDHIYAGVNYLVQGTCADIIKRAMVKLFHHFEFNGMKTRLAAQMHDEFLFYVHEDEWFEVLPNIVDIMQDTILKTKLFVDVSVGCESWADKKPVCKKCWKIAEENHRC